LKFFRLVSFTVNACIKVLVHSCKVSFYVISLTEVYLNLNLFVVLCLVVIYKFVKIFQNLDVALFTHVPFTACTVTNYSMATVFFFVQKITPVIILSCFLIFFGIHISQKIYSVSEMTVEGYTAAIYWCQDETVP